MTDGRGTEAGRWVARWLLLLGALAAGGGADRAGAATAGADSSSAIPVAPRLTLAAAADRARQDNPALVAGRAMESAAAAAQREAAISRLPTIEVSETAVRTNSPADAFGLQLMQERFSFPAFTSSDPNAPDAITNYTTRVQALLPLFTGGQLSAGIGQAERMAAAARAGRAHGEAQLRLAVAGVYLDALLAEQGLSLAERARATTARHVQQAQDFFAAGFLVESDLLAARVQLATMDEAVLTARHQAALARAGLNRVMGAPQSDSYTLVEPAPLDSRDVAGAAAVEAARGARQDRVAVQAGVEAARLGVTRARGDYWPQLGLAASYSLNDDRPFGTHGTSYAVAAVLQWKVWNWGQTHARVQRGEAEYAAARAGQAAWEAGLQFEVLAARQAVDEARGRRQVTAGAVTAAERALTIVEDRFGQGVARMTDLLDAETRAHEARVRDLAARFDLEKAERNWRFTLGQEPVPEVER